MKHFIVIIFAVFALLSCEKMIFEEDKASSDPFVNFEYLWNEVELKYSYHEYKGINWDEIGAKYKAMLYPEISEDSLFTVLSTMLKELRDDHVNLFSPFNISTYEVYRSGPENFNLRTIRDNYITNPRYTGAFAHGFIKAFPTKPTKNHWTTCLHATKIPKV